MKYSLSVIIPNYNKEKYIEKCIDSILNQTLVPNEIIVVDDCSEDNSVEIIKKLQKQNNIIKGIFLKENEGVSNARDVGIKFSKSNYITVIDSDDYYYCNNKLELEMNLIKYYKEKHNEDVVAFSKTVIVDENGLFTNSVINSGNYYFFQGNILFKLLLGIKIGFLPRDYCYLKDLYLKTSGYNKKINLYEDLDLIIKLAQKSKFYCTKEYGTAYRQNTNGLSSKGSLEHKKAKETIYKNNKKLLRIDKRIICKILRNILNIRTKIKKNMELK